MHAREASITPGLAFIGAPLGKICRMLPCTERTARTIFHFRHRAGALITRHALIRIFGAFPQFGFEIRVQASRVENPILFSLDDLRRGPVFCTQLTAHDRLTAPEQQILAALGAV